MTKELAPQRSVVVLVDVKGAAQGEADKLEAHAAPGALHRAFSVFIYRQGGEMLLQRRAPTKYHFPRVWANACCSHPGPGEELIASAEARVFEELGMRVQLREAGAFIYRATCPTSGRVEHEFDHVLIGQSDEEPRPDPSEVEATCWLDAVEIRTGFPEGDHAPWLGPALEIAEAARLSERS